MDFSLRQMEIMRTVVRLGSITDAARFLRVSQPSLSATLKQCATVAGFDLFRRKQGRLTPTEEMIALLPEIDRIFDSVEAIRTRSVDLRDGHAGNLRIACTPALALSVLPAAIHAFSKAHGKVRFTIDTLLTLEVVDEVGAGRADIGLVMSPEEVRGAKVIDLWTSELVCITPPKHPLQKNPYVTPELLKDYPLVSFSRALPLGILIDDAFRKKGIRRNIAIEVGPSALACALVEKGVACAIVDPFVVTHYAGRSLTVLPFKPHTPISAQLLHHPARAPTRVAAMFTKALEEGVKGLKSGTNARGKTLR